MGSKRSSSSSGPAAGLLPGFCRAPGSLDASGDVFQVPCNSTGPHPTPLPTPPHLGQTRARPRPGLRTNEGPGPFPFYARLLRAARLQRRRAEREEHVIALTGVRLQPHLAADGAAGGGRHHGLLQHAAQLEPAGQCAGRVGGSDGGGAGGRWWLGGGGWVWANLPTLARESSWLPGRSSHVTCCHPSWPAQQAAAEGSVRQQGQQARCPLPAGHRHQTRPALPDQLPTAAPQPLPRTSASLACRALWKATAGTGCPQTARQTRLPRRAPCPPPPPAGVGVAATVLGKRQPAWTCEGRMLPLPPPHPSPATTAKW